MFQRIFRSALAITLAAAFAVSPPLTTTAYAWASYSGAFANMMTNPLHEDMTELAYARLLKEQYPAVADSGPVAYTDSGEAAAIAAPVLDSGAAVATAPLTATVTPRELLQAQNAQDYENKVYFLRMGAYWNDVAANNITEFAYAYVNRGTVSPYAGSSYGNAYNVGRHLAETAKHYPRAMVRFSFGERANFLHSMLGVDVNGAYLDQKTVAEFQMQWLEVAYKYARDGNNAVLSADQKALLSFIDPYGQFVQSGQNAVPGSQTPADDKMSEEQLRLRALGSICHTLEDSFNPAHTVRSYYKGGDGSQFGNILAFGNYATQGSVYHQTWDLISPADTAVRTDLLNNTKTLEALKAYNGNFDEQMQTTHTLGLYLAWDAAYELMSLYAQNATWELVEAWLKNEVLVTNFNADGSAIIWDAGRRIGNLAELTTTTEYVGSVMRRKLSGVAEEAKRIEQAGNQLYAYHRNVLDFFHKQQDTIIEPVYHTPYEESGQAAAQAMLQAFRDGLEKASNAELEKMFKEFPASIMPRWKTAMQSLNGIAQEFSLDLNGTQDATAKENLTVIMNVLNRVSTTQLTGVIAAKDESAYLLRTLGPNNVDSVIRIHYGPQTASLQVGQMASITFAERTPELIGQPISYAATRVTPLAGPNRMTAKGILTAHSNTSMVLTSMDGTADYPLELANSRVIPYGLMGQEVAVVYTALPNQPLTAVSVYGLQHAAQQLLPQATVVAMYGGEMRVKLDTAENEEDVFYNITYGDADIIGTPSVNAKVLITYPDMLTDADASPMDGLIMATRIVCDNHTHTLRYQPNGNSTHQAYCTSLDMSTLEDCTRDASGRCTKCGARSSYITVTHGGQTSQLPWGAESLQGALASAQSGDVLQLVPLDGVSTLALGSTALAVSENVTLRLGGVVLRYTGADAALTSSATALKLENGTIASESTALTHTGSGAGTVLTGVTLYAQKGYTVTGGGSVELGAPLSNGRYASLTGGGVDLQSAQPVSVRLNSALQKQQVQLALAQAPTLPITVLTFLKAAPTAQDLANIAYGTKNAYDGDDVYSIAGQQIQLIPKITPTDPKKALINGAAAENSTFPVGTALTIQAFQNNDFTPIQWTLGVTGAFPHAGLVGDYTSDRISTSSFDPGEQTLTIVYQSSTGNLAAEVYTVTFTKSGGGGGGGGGGSSAPKTVAAPSPIGILGNSMDTSPATDAMAKAALASLAANGGARFVNVTNVAPRVSASIASGAPAGTKIFADTMENNAVLARMAFDAAAAAKLTAPMDTRMDLTPEATANVRTLFQKWYSNKLAFAALGQRGAYGTPVELSLKLNLAGMDAANLRAYSYNPATNEYFPLAKPWQDKNGYTHVTVSMGGYVIVSDGALAKNQTK